jgi:hypothetical protein
MIPPVALTRLFPEMSFELKSSCRRETPQEKTYRLEIRSSFTSIRAGVIL